MIQLRGKDERGHTQQDWLDSWHTFSFGEYVDRRHVHFASLRVINEDIVKPKRGFGMHFHRDMEIVTYVLEGALRHEDSMGNGSVIRPGEIQKMSAGSGVMHSEFNASDNELVHLLQIWIMPREQGIEPSYEQHKVDRTVGKLVLIASPSGGDGIVTIHQDASVYAAQLDAGGFVRHVLPKARCGWLQAARGEITVNGTRLKAGDGAAIVDESDIDIAAQEMAEILLFDMLRS